MAKVKKLPKDFPDSVIDVFEAIRRALVRRGLFRDKTKVQKKTLAENEASGKSSSHEKGPEELIAAAEKAHEILFKASTVFPFTLFPDTVTLDREKVSFATRFFFRVAKVTSIPVRDLLSVEADVGPFFGSVHTASRYFITNPKEINFLWRKDAIRLHRLLQGYIIVHEQNIDCANVEKDDLITLLDDLGKGDTG
jgi:hypothetical protein